MQDRTHDGKAFRIFNVIDEYTRECLAARVAWSFTQQDGITTQFIRDWVGCLTESFNGKLRDELLNREIFYSLQEAEVLIEQWRIEYNTIRPHSALGYRPPATQAVIELSNLFQPLVLS